MTHPLLQDGITISGDARDQQYDRYVNRFSLFLLTTCVVESPFEFPKSPKDKLYLQPLAMIEIDIEAVAVVEPHKEVPVAKLHEEVDLVKVQNTIQVIMVENQEEVAHPKDVAQKEEAHPKEEEEALLKDVVQE